MSQLSSGPRGSATLVVEPKVDRQDILSEPSPSARSLVDVHLFGALEVRVDGTPVAQWRGQLGPNILRFLLLRSGRVCARDEILEAFWPDCDPIKTRNRLQAALSAMRSGLRDVTGSPVIEFVDGAYRLASDIDLVVDVDEFDACVAGARRLEARGDLDGARGAYRRAIDLYTADLASDIPYDDWALLVRERYKIIYVDVLDRLADLQVDAGDVDGCITTCHRLLEQDPCREDVHRRLMDCYARQGRVHQVSRQYDFCRRALDSRLGLRPSAETSSLYRRLVH